jgi:hypothetical protein
VDQGCLEASPAVFGGSHVYQFQTADEDEERVRATYGAKYDRLVEAKVRFDPGNLFRSNRNIRPTSPGEFLD